MQYTALVKFLRFIWANRQLVTIKKCKKAQKHKLTYYVNKLKKKQSNNETGDTTKLKLANNETANTSNLVKKGGRQNVQNGQKLENYILNSDKKLNLICMLLY